jgi:hypothetical protein
MPECDKAFREDKLFQNPLLEFASQPFLNIEAGVVSRPHTLVCQLEIVSTYDFRDDLLNLGHGNLGVLASMIDDLWHEME